MMDKNVLMKVSFTYIERNLDVDSNEIPLHFISAWSVDSFDELWNGNMDTDQNSFAFQVLLYAIMQRKFSQGITKFELSIDTMFNYFKTFQLILASRIIHEQTDLRIEGVRIFDFDNYHRLKLHIKKV